jgi:molybdopterin converting factor small subunit
MATVWIPSLLRPHTGGEEQVVVPGRTVGDAIDALERTYPGLEDKLRQGNRLAPALQALVDGRAALLGLAEPVGKDSEILFLPTISGG